MALPGGAYTVQIAHAASPSGFGPVIAALGIDARETYAVAAPSASGTRWLLLWSHFPSSDAARVASDRLPRVPGANVGYPRRVSLIQNELRGR